jgi:hypothetical protein
MSSYNPPIENVPIFDSALFREANDGTLTIAVADKRYLKYPNAQGTETLQAINVNGLATFNQPTTMTYNNGTILTIQRTGGGVTNAGLVMTNAGINQNSGSYVNSLNQINMNSNSDINIAGGSIYQYQPSSSYFVRQYLNSGALKWDSNVSGSVQNVFTLNNTDLTFAPPIKSSATIPASNDSSTRVPTTAWVQSAITSGSSNITPNSVTITPTNFNTAGLKSSWNYGSISSINGIASTVYGTTSSYVPNGVPRIRIKGNTTSQPIPTGPIEFRLTMFFYNNNTNSYGQTCCNLLIFPVAIQQNWGNSTNQIYNINNKVNGNNGTNIAITNDPVNCPLGRQFWTYNQQFSGVTGSQGWLYGVNTSTGTNFQYDIYINTLLPSSGYTYSTTMECIQSLGFTGGSNVGIQIDAYA